MSMTGHTAWRKSGWGRSLRRKSGRKRAPEAEIRLIRPGEVTEAEIWPIRPGEVTESEIRPGGVTEAGIRPDEGH